MTRLPSLRVFLALFSIAANALTAGGIFTFPLMSPALAKNLKLSQPELTTIILAALCGQYTAAAGVGYLIDSYGPWLCSLLAAILFSAGYGLFSLEISSIPSVEPISQTGIGSSFHFFVFLFLLLGLGTVNSYFSALFAATKFFPRHTGLAAGLSMSLFGLSPLVLSVIAGIFFDTPEEELDVTGYTRFLAILTLIVHIIGAFTLNIPASSERAEESSAEADESAPLLPPRQTEDSDPKTSLGGVLTDPSFWILAFVAGMTLGSSEMVISNIGTIVLSLRPNPRSVAKEISTVAMAARQVRILSVSNTAARLLAGFLADWVSPLGAVPETNSPTNWTTRKRRVSRVAFLVGFSALLSLTFSWMAFGVNNRDMIWPVSIGVGTSYGAIFTIVPTLISAFWGASNVARNFGLITYAPFLMTPTFSYIYAFLSDAHANDGSSDDPSMGRVCHGVDCWRTTMEISALATFAAMTASALLWRWWRTTV